MATWNYYTLFQQSLDLSVNKPCFNIWEFYLFWMLHLMWGVTLKFYLTPFYNLQYIAVRWNCFPLVKVILNSNSEFVYRSLIKERYSAFKQLVLLYFVAVVWTRHATCWALQVHQTTAAKDTNLAVTCRPLINIYCRERSCFFLLAFAVVHLFVNILCSLAGSIGGTLRLCGQASRYAEKKQMNCLSTKIIKLIKKK